MYSLLLSAVSLESESVFESDEPDEPEVDEVDGEDDDADEFELLPFFFFSFCSLGCMTAVSSIRSPSVSASASVSLLDAVSDLTLSFFFFFLGDGSPELKRVDPRVPFGAVDGSNGFDCG